MQLLSLAALVLPAYVCAQYGFDPSTEPTTTAAPVSLPSGTVQVMLGEQNAISFTPNTVNVPMGGTVVITVSSQSSVMHGAVQSSPDAPCSQLAGGFDSGLMPPGSSTAITVNTTGPISFFCPQTAPIVHCEMGMVLIINPTSPSDISSLISAATQVTSEATATMVQSSGSGIEATTVPTAISGSSSGSSSGSGGNTSGALKGSVATTAGFLTAVFGLFFTMA